MIRLWKCWGIVLAIFVGFIAVAPQGAHSCTGIVIESQDGSPVYARTMEFGADLLSFNLIVVPRGHEYSGMTPDGKPGLSWKVKYGHVGFSPFGMPAVVDGLNEKGLACGGFYLPGYAKYQDYREKDRGRTISNMDFIGWVLSNFASISELRQALQEITVTGSVLQKWGFVPPLHYLAVDESGSSIVIEYVDGRLQVHENPLGVITNTPSYDWHMTNMRNYIGLSALNRPTRKLGGKEFAPMGQGSGALGLPGDFTPPSRFVRAVYLAQSTYHAGKADEEVLVAFRILNQFDIPRGAIREEARDGKTITETTQWTSACDLKNRRYYFHTEYSRRLRMVDLGEVDLNAARIKTMEVTSPEKIEDVSGELK